MSTNVHAAAPRRVAVAVAVTPRAALAAVVAASAVARLVLAFGRATQGYLPDEYLYGQLARSLAEGHGTRVLGVSGGWTPALLQPLLTAPAWLFHDPDVAFRLTQAVNVAAMSLGGLVVYAIARTLGVSAWTSVAVAVAALASPDALYTGYVTADAIGYALALLAILAAVRALDRPTRRAQALFLLAAGLATFARIQYAALFAAAVVAAAVVERGRPGALLRRHLPLGLPIAAGAALVVGGGLGRYSTAASFGISPDALRWMPASAVLLAVAAGVVVVPGALAWMGSEIVRPATRARAAFASVTVALVGALVVASAVMSSDTGSDRFFERYLMLGVPLAAIAFSCWAEGGRPLQPVALALAAVLVLVVARVPVSQYVAGQGSSDSPTLFAVLQLQGALGVGGASLAVALGVTACAALAAATAVGRLGARGALLTTAAILALLSAGASREDHRRADEAVRVMLGGNPSWVDRATGGRNALLVVSTRAFPSAAMLTALRNVSITGIGLLGTQTRSFDGAAARLEVDPQGGLRLGGATVRQPLVVDRSTARPVFANAPTRAAGGSFRLVDPAGPARLAALLEGMYADGWLSGTGSLTLYGTGRAGSCRSAELQLRVPRAGRATALTLTGAGGSRSLRLAPGASTVLTVEGAAARPVTLSFTATKLTFLDTPSLRPVSARARLTTAVGPCSPVQP